MIEFELREIPHRADEEARGFYPVVADLRRTTTAQLCASIEKRCTVNTADIKAVLSALADVLGEDVGRGHIVDVAEVGSFRPSLACDRPITDASDKQIARHLSVDGIVFHPKRSLMQRMGQTTFRRAEVVVPATVHLTTEELKERITAFFSSSGKSVLLRSDLEQITGYRKTCALKVLKLLTDEGFLVRHGSRQSPVYTLASAE